MYSHFVVVTRNSEWAWILLPIIYLFSESFCLSCIWVACHYIQNKDESHNVILTNQNFNESLTVQHLWVIDAVSWWAAKWKEGSRCGATWPDLKLAAFFPSGPLWQMWLEHRANYYMSPTTAYMFACWEVRQLLAEGWRFPLISSPYKINRHDDL